MPGPSAAASTTSVRNRIPDHGLPSFRGRLVRRYKRFLADVELDDGRRLTVHCPNSGSMKGMVEAGLPVVVSDSMNPARKLRHTLELVQVDDGPGKTWVGVNTARPNAWVEHAIVGRHLTILPSAADVPLRVRREVRYGQDMRSRIDLLVETDEDGTAADLPTRTFVEVKNTTLSSRHSGARGTDADLHARFPDAVTTRGQKHLMDLMEVADAGDGAALVFLVNRHDCGAFSPAEDIDPDYARLLGEAMDRGVRALPLQVRHHVRRKSGRGREGEDASCAVDVASTLGDVLPLRV